MDRFRKYEAKIEEYLSRPETKNQIINYLLTIKEYISFEDWKLNIRGQFFVPEIRTGCPDNIIDSINKAQNEYGKPEVDEFIVDFLKEDSDIEMDYTGFLYLLNQQFKSHRKETLTKESVNLICNRRLDRYTQKGTDISKAFTHFYSCWDYVDKENTVHITNEALKIMHGFIEKFPGEYLEFLIRPRYVPAKSKLDGDFYSFVLEPFTDKIFGGWLKFEEFLNCQQEVNSDITSYVSTFYDKYKVNSYKFVGIRDNEIDNYGNLLRKWIN